MQPTCARMVFPCFDEPALKATFGITLIIDKQLTGLSNMDVASETEEQGGAKKVVKFNNTPRMSTYVVSIVIGDLTYTESEEFRVPVRVYVPGNKNIEHSQFSLELITRALASCEDLFDSPYPLPKMDIVAIPHFLFLSHFRCMESWGLMIFKPNCLLLDEKDHIMSIRKRKQIAHTVLHELVHQWFGNLVTPHSWDGLWLSEGPAGWIAFYLCNSLYPDWKFWETYAKYIYQEALSLDSFRGSHPIEVSITHDDNAGRLFNLHTYHKASAIIQMLFAFLGPEVFIKGICQYLKKHAYSNAHPDNFFDALNSVSGKEVKDMRIWTKCTGYPVLTVTEDTAIRTIYIKQTRFLQTGDAKPEEDETLFPVALRIGTDTSVEDVVLVRREDTFKVQGRFLRLNVGCAGFYRTMYTGEQIDNLGEAVRDKLLPATDRFGILSDAWALAISGHQGISDFLNLLKYFDSETEVFIWKAILSLLQRIQPLCTSENRIFWNGINSLQLKLVQKMAHAEGWEIKNDDNEDYQELKAKLFHSAGLSGDKIIINAANAMFDNFRERPIHSKLELSVFSIVLRHGMEHEVEHKYNAILEHYKSQKSDAREALICLGQSNNPKLIKRTLSLVFDEGVAYRDIYLPIIGLQVHPEGVEALLCWLVENRDKLLQKYPREESNILETIIGFCTSCLTSQDQLERVEKFCEDETEEGFRELLGGSCTKIKDTIAMAGRIMPDVKEYLRQRGYVEG